MESYIPSPRRPEVDEREYFGDLKQVNSTKVSITIGGKPTLSRIGKQVDIHTKAVAYAGRTKATSKATYERPHTPEYYDNSALPYVDKRNSLKELKRREGTLNF